MNLAAWRLAMVLLLLSATLMLLGVCIGSAGFEDLLRPLVYPQVDPAHSALASQIVLDIRLPRTIGAWTAGALLGLAGAVAQGLFRNPLADPYLLGSASGAALAVALAGAAAWQAFSPAAAPPAHDAPPGSAPRVSVALSLQK